MLLKWLWISFIGGIICLDNVAIGQFLISRPICSGPLIGWILGDIRTGLMVGTILEILWITPIPVGACVLPDIESSCIVATTVAVGLVSLRRFDRLSILGIAICISLPIAQLGHYGGVFVRRINNRISNHAVNNIEKSDHIMPWLGLGILVFFLRHFLTCFIALAVFTPTIEFLLPILSKGLLRGFALITIWCPVLGLATIVRKADEKKRYYLLLLGFSLAFILNAIFPENGLRNLLFSVSLILGIFIVVFINRLRTIENE